MKKILFILFVQVLLVLNTSQLWAEMTQLDLTNGTT